MNVDLITEAVRTVEQARHGDQNAMALIEGVRASSEEGSPRARVTLKVMGDYIDRHPVDADSFGAEPQLPRELLYDLDSPHTALSAIAALSSFPKGESTAQARLVHGPALTPEVLSAMAAPFAPPLQEAFFKGVHHPKVRAKIRLDVTLESWRDVGRCVGMARLLQAFVRGYLPLAAVSRALAWELGEPIPAEEPDEDEKDFQLFVLRPANQTPKPASVALQAVHA
jgi:hypothetical protein